MQKEIFSVVAGMCLVLFPPAAEAANVTISATPEGDGYFHNESGSSWDYFDSTSLSVSSHYEFWGTSDTLIYNTGYVQFSLASLPADAVISSATLNLFISEIHYSSDSPSGGYIRFVEAATANGNASQKLNGSVTLVELKDQPAGWLSINITPQLQTAVDNGYAFMAFSANPNTSGYFRNAGFSFVSADNGTDGPYLNVTTVPEPALLALLTGLPVLAWVWVRRRK